MTVSEIARARHAGAPVYFPNLHGIRGLAACMVIVGHIEAIKERIGVPNLSQARWVADLGATGVDAFFTLSGFLITYLLCAERAETGTVRVGRFYARRALRIWPLYYLVLLLGFTAWPALIDTTLFLDPLTPPIWKKLTLFALLLPNVVFAFVGHVRFLGPLWSIGVEEQFYLLWPVVARRVGLTGLGMVCVAAIALLTALRIGLPGTLQALLAQGWTTPRLADGLSALLRLSRFECMLCGALAALWLFQRASRAPTPSRSARRASWALVLGMVALGAPGTVVAPLVHGLAFAQWIVVLATSRRPNGILESAGVRVLGQVSYGMYLVHMAVLLALVPQVPAAWAHSAPWLFNAIVYGGGFGLTFALALASYHGFERPLLRFKARFAVVQSRGVES